MATSTNPREKIGGNNNEIDYLADETARLQSDYAELTTTIDRLVAEADRQPATINDDETSGVVSALVIKIKDAAGRAEAYRVAEKEPSLRKGEACDNHFNGQKERCVKRQGVKNAKPGAADILYAKVHDWNMRKLAAEQERLRVAAAKAEAERFAAEQAERKRIAEAEAARVAAEKARVRVEEKTSVAEVKEAIAADARVETMIATDKANQAEIRTFAKPADLVRTRHETGVMSTMATEAYCEVIPGAEHMLDMVKLWPLVSDAEKAKALRKWADLTDHKVMMDGAKIGRRPKTMLR